MARVELTHGTPLLVREGWTEVVQEPAVVALVPPGPECEEANDPLSPATRFLCHLEEDLVPWHFDYTTDSDGDYLHPYSPLQTITHALKLGDLQPSFTPITQISALSEERDPNNNTPTPDPPAPALLSSQRLCRGPSLDWWLEQDLHPEPVVLRPFDSMQCILGSFKRESVCYSPTSGTTHLMNLVNFSLLILSYLIISDFELWGDSLWELTYLMPFTTSQTRVCLMVNLVLLKLNFILDSSFLCCALLCCHTHAHHTCPILLFHSATAMWLHHVFNLCHACSRQYW